MRKVKIIDLLNLVANGKIKNNQFVIIRGECYIFYVKSFTFDSADGKYFRIFKTSELNDTCYIINECDN